MSDELKEELLLEFKEEVETKILERYPEFNKRKKDESFYNELMDMSEEIYSYIKEFHKSFLENPEAYINFLFPRDNRPPTMDYFFSCVDSSCSRPLSKLMKSVEKLLKEKYSEKLEIFEIDTKKLSVREEIKKKYAFEMWKENLHKLVEDVEIPREVLGTYREFAQENWGEDGEKNLETHFGRLKPIKEESKYGIVAESMRENSCDIKKAKKSAEKKGVNPKNFDPLLSYAVKKGLIERKGEPRNYEYYFQEN